MILLLSFFWGVIPQLLTGAALPQWGVHYLAPFVVLAALRCSLPISLWLALGCGLLVDLLTSETRLGFHALSYCIALTIVYGLKGTFFRDNRWALPILTCFFTLALALLEGVLYLVLDATHPLSLVYLGKNLFLIPLVDGLYGFVWFSLPAFCYARWSRKTPTSSSFYGSRRPR